MGLFDKVLKEGIKSAVNSVSDVVERGVQAGVQKTVAPKVEQAAADAVNRATENINQATGQLSAQPQSTVNQTELNQAASTLGGLFGSMQTAAMGFANEAAKNMKVCPSCGEAAPAETKFCPGCGAALPEKTVAEGSVCSSCGKQNSIGVKFCTDCGAKLPFALAEEQAAQQKDAAVLASWNTFLPQYPAWRFGGTNIGIEEMGLDENSHVYYGLHVENAQYSMLEQYRDLLRQNGFREAGQYPTAGSLYKKIDGVCYCFNSEEPFPSDEGYLIVHFLVREPAGGFDYVKPEPRQKSGGLFDLFK